MGNPLLDRRAPSDWYRSGQSIDFAEEVRSFPRFAEAVEAELEALDPEWPAPDARKQAVSGHLKFDKLGGWRDLYRLSGRLHSDVDLVCQRCLGPCRQTLDSEVNYLLGEDAAAADAGEDVWELDEPVFRLLDVVDELLVMSLPIAVRHDDRECASDPVEEPQPEPGAETNTTRPFADLKRRLERD